MDTSPKPNVGIIGLGIMGLSYARHLLQAGYNVIGFDVAPMSAEALGLAGGSKAGSPREVALRCPVVLSALPSDEALDDIHTGPEGLPGGLGAGSILCEFSTLSIEAKERCRSALEQVGAVMLDCPVSGTGAQAARGDIDIFASGDENSVEALRPLFASFSRQTYYVGPFGNGMKYKYVANLLVTIHNVAAAEALALARKAGLDPAHVLRVITTGAGTSRMLELRGPLMVADTYTPATAKVGVHLKDIGLIDAFARINSAPVPLFDASVPFYRMAAEQGRRDQDTASVFAIIDGLTDAPAMRASNSTGATKS